MSRAGPQKYPRAARGAHWYQDQFQGDRMESNVGVIHTTEGTSVPSYGGGASAPNFTALPDIGARKLRWYQHFDFDVSSRALVNRYGGVETNTLNAVQIELVGTCDPRHRTSWGGRRAGRDYLYWPDAPDWALAELAEFVRWSYDEHDVPLRCDVEWLPYPESYGNSRVRLSGAQWADTYGWVGHMHVAENHHGDPGDLDFARVLELAGGATPNDAPPVKNDRPPRYRNTIQGLEYGYGAHGDHVTTVDKALIREGCGAHHDGDGYQPGPRWTDYTTLNYADWQRKCSYTGDDADGVPGESSLRALLGELPPDEVPTVDLSKLRKAARENPPASGQPVTYSGVKIVEKALVDEGLLDPAYADGHFGTTAISAYARWQRSRAGGNYRGKDADGVPGKASLTRLGKKYNFKVRT